MKKKRTPILDRRRRAAELAFEREGRRAAKMESACVPIGKAIHALARTAVDNELERVAEMLEESDRPNGLYFAKMVRQRLGMKLI